MSTKAVVGSVLALVLLGLYVLLIATAIVAPGSFSADMTSALALISGLVTALIVAELAVTEPGKPPAASTLAPDASDRAQAILRWVVSVYIAVWALCGLAALLSGWYQAGVGDAVMNLGKAWLGTALMATYAYLNVQPAASTLARLTVTSPSQPAAS